MNSFFVEVLIRGSFQLSVSVRPCWKLRTRPALVEGSTSTASFDKKTVKDASETPKKSARERELIQNYWYMDFVGKERRKRATSWSFGRTTAFQTFPRIAWWKHYARYQPIRSQHFALFLVSWESHFHFSRFVTLPASLVFKRFTETKKELNKNSKKRKKIGRKDF